jgi:hypothetical protein
MRTKILALGLLYFLFSLLTSAQEPKKIILNASDYVYVKPNEKIFHLKNCSELKWKYNKQGLKVTDAWQLTLETAWESEYKPCVKCIVSKKDKILKHTFLYERFFTEKHLVPPKTKARIQEKAIQKAMQEGEQLIQKLRIEGLIDKISPELHEVFVYPLIWNSIKYDEKESFAFFLAGYCGKKDGTNNTWVEIKDTYSGKKLAKYDAWGFKVY